MDQIIEKIQKLQNHAMKSEELGNEAEAQVFAAKIQELLLRYELSMDDIAVEKMVEMKEEIGSERVRWENYGLESTQRRCNWIEMLANIITKAYACKFLVHPCSNHISIVGHKTNRELAVYTFVSLVRAADGLSTKAYQRVYAQNRNEASGYRKSWLLGFCSKIQERLQILKNNPIAQDGTNLSTALVRIDRKREEVENYVYIDMGCKKAHGLNHISTHNRNGYRDGQEYASKISFTKGLNKTSHQMKALN